MLELYSNDNMPGSSEDSDYNSLSRALRVIVSGGIVLRMGPGQLAMSLKYYRPCSYNNQLKFDCSSISLLVC